MLSERQLSRSDGPPVRGTARQATGTRTLAAAQEVTAAYTNDSFEVIVTRLGVEPETARAAAALLCEGERERAARFVSGRDRNRFIVARAELRKLLAARLGLRPRSVELTYGRHGKPALARDASGQDLRFNVSHCEDVAAYAFSFGREIGVDIEAVRVLPDADDVAARFFSFGENEAYRDLDARDKPRGFFNCWTRKEAFVKALGLGLHFPLDSFDVSLAPGEPAKILRVGDSRGDECGWSLSSFTPAQGFAVAVVCEHRGSP